MTTQSSTTKRIIRRTTTTEVVEEETVEQEQQALPARPSHWPTVWKWVKKLAGPIVFLYGLYKKSKGDD